MLTIFIREITPLLRNPFGLVFTLGQPLVFLFLFGPLLPGSPWQWFVPGILVMMCLFATAGAGYTLLMEINDGSMERLLVTPLSRVSILAGKTLKETSALLAQAALIIAAVLPFGFRLHPLSTLAGLALLMLSGVGMGSLTVALAIAARRQQEMFWGMHQFALFPVVLLSGTLLPLDDAPGWLAAASSVNPVTYLVEAERALFAGDFTSPAVLPGALAAMSLAAIGLFTGQRSMRRITV
jgi:ABC-2 type transport system permease protein